jgi:hypothetical protein
MDPRAYVQPQYVEGFVNKEAEKLLTFKDMFREIRTDATSFREKEDLTTAGDDITSGVMAGPAEITEEAELATIDVSPITYTHGNLNGFGYQVRVNPRTLREIETIDELQRAYEHAAYGLAKSVNMNIVNKLKGVTNDITEVAGSAVWSSATADPIGDIINFKNASKVEGYESRMNNLFLHPTNYNELEFYMVELDRTWAIDPRNEGGDSIPNIRGVSIQEVATDELAEGSYLGLDSRYPALTVYKYMNPQKSTNPADNRIMVSRFQEPQAPNLIIIELTMEYGLSLQKPNSISYRASGI